MSYSPIACFRDQDYGVCKRNCDQIDNCLVCENSEQGEALLCTLCAYPYEIVGHACAEPEIDKSCDLSAFGCSVCALDAEGKP